MDVIALDLYIFALTVSAKWRLAIAYIAKSTPVDPGCVSVKDILKSKLRIAAEFAAVRRGETLS